MWQSAYQPQSNKGVAENQQGGDSNHNPTWIQTKMDIQTRANMGFKSNWQYRKYMTDNAAAIREHNRVEACRAAQADPFVASVVDPLSLPASSDLRIPPSPIMQTHLEKNRQTEDRWDKLHNRQFYTVPQVNHYLENGK